MRNLLPLLTALTALAALSACDPTPPFLAVDASVCHAGLANCDGKCVALGVDNDNCGGCGVKCSDQQQCIAAIIAGRCMSRN